MSRSFVPKRALAHLQVLCDAQLPPLEFVPALLDALHAVIPSARNLFDWTDAEGRLLHYFIEGPIDTRIARLYFDEFHNKLETRWMPAFESLRRTPGGVRSALPLMTAEFRQSALYHEIWRPQGFHSRIEGVVRSASGRLLGSLVLYRGPDDPPFDAEEENALAALLPWVARALENTGCAADDEVYVPASEPAEMLLIAPDGSLLQVSAGAPRLLLLADGGLSRAALQGSMPARVQRLFARLLLAVRQPPPAGARPHSRDDASMTITNPNGRFVAVACRLQPFDADAADGVTLLTLQRLEPRSVAVHRVLRQLPLTAFQVHVCAGLHRGRSYAAIADEMHIRSSTVVDHVRKAYRSLGVADAAELRLLVDRRIAG
ncbi:hypothetical protein CKO44_10310 [Rubrivivax gelatinosus]|nr:hypothetical protein [Rubrivivax gelatinosus]